MSSCEPQVSRVPDSSWEFHKRAEFMFIEFKGKLPALRMRRPDLRGAEKFQPLLIHKMEGAPASPPSRDSRSQ